MTDAVLFAGLSLGVGLVSIGGRAAWLRATAYAGLVVGLLFFWYASLGLPRPQYFQMPSGTVLAYRLEEPDAIYLWLVPDGRSQPLALQLPWQTDVASDLVDAARRRGNPGDSLKMDGSGSTAGRRAKPVFYVSHVTDPPPKAPER